MDGVRATAGSRITHELNIWCLEIPMCSRDNQKIISTSFEHLKKCMNLAVAGLVLSNGTMGGPYF